MCQKFVKLQWKKFTHTKRHKSRRTNAIFSWKFSAKFMYFTKTRYYCNLLRTTRHNNIPNGWIKKNCWYLQPTWGHRKCSDFRFGRAVALNSIWQHLATLMNTVELFACFFFVLFTNDLAVFILCHNWKTYANRILLFHLNDRDLIMYRFGLLQSESIT